MGIAEASIAPLGEHRALADPGEVGQQRFVVGVENLGAFGNLEHDAGAGRAGAVLAHAMTAGPGLEMLLIPIIDERVEAIHAFGNHIAAAPAIAAVRPAELDELLAPERHAARPAVAGADMDLGLVEEFHGASNFRYLPISRRYRPVIQDLILLLPCKHVKWRHERLT